MLRLVFVFSTHMSNPVKLSIITVCYNEKRLEATCESITRQTWQDFEWIVMDGGSREETLATFARYRDRMACFVSEKDNGIYHAMNKGIAQARGEYVLFMNAGDYFLDPYALEGLFSQEPFSEDILICEALYVSRQGDSFVWQYKDSLPISAEYLINHYLPHQASLIRRELFTRYGGYNEQHRVVSDWEKWIEFIVVHKVSCRYVRQVLSIQNTDGISVVNVEQNAREREEVLRQYFPQLFDEDAPSGACPGGIRPRVRVTCRVKLFHFLPLLRITEQAGANGRSKLRVYLFYFLPLLKLTLRA